MLAQKRRVRGPEPEKSFVGFQRLVVAAETALQADEQRPESLRVEQRAGRGERVSEVGIAVKTRIEGEKTVGGRGIAEPQRLAIRVERLRRLVVPFVKLAELAAEHPVVGRDRDEAQAGFDRECVPA